MKKLPSIIYKIIGAGVVIFGIIINLVGSNNLIEYISYFTMLTNTVVAGVLLLEILILFELISINPVLFRIIKGSSIIAMIIMLIVYNFILAPYIKVNIPTYQVYSLKDIFIHYLSPIIIFLDYMFFDEKGLYEYKDAVRFINYVYIYVLYVIVYVLLGGRFMISGEPSIYPYFFLNFETQGIWLTLAYGLGIGLAFNLVGLMFVYLDHILKRPIKKISL